MSGSKVDKIQKILNLAANNPDKHEAAVAWEKAARLMMEYINETASQRALLEKIVEQPVAHEKPDPYCHACTRLRTDHTHDCPTGALERRITLGAYGICGGCLTIGALVILILVRYLAGG